MSQPQSVTMKVNTAKKTGFCQKIREIFAVLFCCFTVKKQKPVENNQLNGQTRNMTSSIDLEQRTSQTVTLESTTPSIPESQRVNHNVTSDEDVIFPPESPSTVQVKQYLDFALEALNKKPEPNSFFCLMGQAIDCINTIANNRGLRCGTDLYTGVIEDWIQKYSDQDPILEFTRKIKERGSNLRTLCIIIINTMNKRTHDWNSPRAGQILHISENLIRALTNHVFTSEERHLFDSEIESIVHADGDLQRIIDQLENQNLPIYENGAGNRKTPISRKLVQLTALIRAI